MVSCAINYPVFNSQLQGRQTKGKIVATTVLYLDIIEDRPSYAVQLIVHSLSISAPLRGPNQCGAAPESGTSTAVVRRYRRFKIVKSPPFSEHKIGPIVTALNRVTVLELFVFSPACCELQPLCTVFLYMDTRSPTSLCLNQNKDSMATAKKPLLEETPPEAVQLSQSEVALPPAALFAAGAIAGISEVRETWQRSCFTENKC